MDTANKKYQEIVEKAWQDEAFKKALIADPKKVLKEIGAFIPDNINLKVIEETADEVYVIIPKKPEPKPYIFVNCW